MEYSTLLKLSENKELKINNAYFHGEKIETLLKSLKKHKVLIHFQENFLNPGNMPDLVIEYSGPSIGQFTFTGQIYSRPELKVNEANERALKIAKEKKEKIELKAAKKLKVMEQKKLKKEALSYKGQILRNEKESLIVFINGGYPNEGIVKTYLGFEKIELSLCPITSNYYFFLDGIFNKTYWIKDFKPVLKLWSL